MQDLVDPDSPGHLAEEDYRRVMQMITTGPHGSNKIYSDSWHFCLLSLTVVMTWAMCALLRNAVTFIWPVLQQTQQKWKRFINLFCICLQAFHQSKQTNPEENQSKS